MNRPLNRENAMQVVTAEETHRLLDYPGLVEALRELFRRGVDQVERALISQPLPEGGRNDWLILPAWQYGRHQGVKLVSVFPGNEARGIASVQGLYLLFDGTSGLPLLCVDGAALTLRKTAANSALAATFLARRDASTLLMVGAGAMAPHLIAAHAAVRPIRRVLIWNRSPARAEALARDLDLPKVEVSVAGDLAAAVGEADVVSAATMSRDPLIRGDWLKPGQHLDLVGGYREDMREADDAAVSRSRIFVDARFTAAAHAGDICQPLAAGLIADADITDTFQLARGERPGRQNEAEITLFKSGGGGHEDLGTAQYLLSRLQEKAGA
jgi:ornithine cyclodeaminase